jgi:ferric enterobactin receptor
MRLKTTKKLRYINRFTKTLSKAFALTFILFLGYYHANSQENSNCIVFNNSSLSDALLAISKKLDIKIAFDASKLKEAKVTCNISSQNPDIVLDSLLINTGFTFQYKHNRYLIICPGNQHSSQNSSFPDTYIGIVIDKETREPLPYANINWVERKINFFSTTNGTFFFKRFDTIPIHLKISYLGYYSVDTLLNLDESGSDIVVMLNKNTLKLNSVDVKASKIEMIDIGNYAGQSTVNPVRLVDLPNYGETDVFRSLQLLPGISYSENSSGLNIRGGSSDQNLVLYDGITLYNLEHFFGVFSSINPYIIKDIQVFKGGFESKYGGRVSGVLDITGKSGNKEKATIYGGFNLINGNLALEVPVSKKLTLVAAGRRSYSDLYTNYFINDLFSTQVGKKPERNTKATEELNDIEPEFYFYDYNTKLTYTPSNRQMFSMSFYGGKDYINYSNDYSNETETVNTIDYTEWKNYGLSFSWMKNWRPGYFTIVQTGFSGYTNTYYDKTNIEVKTPEKKFISDEFLSKEDNHIEDLSFSVQNIYQPDNQNKIEFGLSVKQNLFNYFQERDNKFIYSDITNTANIISLFFQDKITLTSKLSLVPGMRINYYNKNSSLFFEPRFAMNYKLFDKILLKAACGKYDQFVKKVNTLGGYSYNSDFWILSDEYKHPVLTSNHLILGSNFQYKHFDIDIEGYIKTIDGLQQYVSISPLIKREEFEKYFVPDSPNSFSNFFVTGTGQCLGLDVLLKYEYRHFSSWLSYSLSKAAQKYRLINNNEETPMAYDQTHKLNWLNMLTFKNFSFSSVYVFSSGQPYVDFNQVTDAQPNYFVYKRLPDYHRLDVSANYNFYLKGLNLKTGFSLINCLNANNYYDVYSRKFDVNNTSFGETSLVKSQARSFVVFLNFRF